MALHQVWPGSCLLSFLEGIHSKVGFKTEMAGLFGQPNADDLVIAEKYQRLVRHNKSGGIGGYFEGNMPPNLVAFGKIT